MKYRIIAKVVVLRYNIIEKNTLLLIYKSIIYLNFINIYKSGFNKLVMKCVQYFAIFYLGSSLSNYTTKTIYIIANLKKLQNK